MAISGAVFCRNLCLVKQYLTQVKHLSKMIMLGCESRPGKVSVNLLVNLFHLNFCYATILSKLLFKWRNYEYTCGWLKVAGEEWGIHAECKDAFHEMSNLHFNWSLKIQYTRLFLNTIGICYLGWAQWLNRECENKDPRQRG